MVDGIQIDLNDIDNRIKAIVASENVSSFVTSTKISRLYDDKEEKEIELSVYQRALQSKQYVSITSYHSIIFLFLFYVHSNIL